MTRVAILEGENLEPGADGLVQLRLEKKAVALPGDRFVIRSYSPITTIGGGVILDPLPRKHRRFRPPIQEQLARLESGAGAQRIHVLLEEAGDYGLPARQLAVRTGLGYHPVEELLDEMAQAEEVIVSRTGEGLLAYSRVVFDKIKERLIRALEKYHRANPAKTGIGREELRMRVAKELPDRPYRNLLAALREQGDILLDGDTVRLGGHEASLTPQQESLAELAEELRSSLTDLKTVLNLMAEKGDVIRVKDDYFITSAACNSLKDGIHRFFENNRELALADFREIANTTRKWMIPLLEYLDRTQVTMRKGDVRIRRGQGSPGE